jgi:large subunit ribosomal protein L25
MSSDHVSLKAAPRTEFGSTVTRRLRRGGQVPGVLYRAGEESVAFSVPARELMRAIHGEHGKTAVFEISVDGHDTVPALLKDWQLNPVRVELLHVDFQQVDLKVAVQANVPLVLEGVAVGVRDGGVLGQPVHEITVSALPDQIPDGITVDVSALEAGGVLHLSDVRAPTGVEIIGDPEAVVASVTAPSRVELPEGEEGVEGEEGEAAEPEVVGESGDDSGDE